MVNAINNNQTTNNYFNPGTKPASSKPEQVATSVFAKKADNATLAPLAESMEGSSVSRLEERQGDAGTSIACVFLVLSCLALGGMCGAGGNRRR